MEKIIIKRNLIRISEATFKEILEAVASDGEVYFNFKDGAKKAKVKFGGKILDVAVKTASCSSDEIVVGDYEGGYACDGLQYIINQKLKTKYEIVYEDIEI